MAKFKAKARAIELLGKGQIADLPTAITELWKNGYDAYAKNLTCKLFLETYKDNTKPVFQLSDDGFGMSESDILNKWFVLGTDSKARSEKISPHFNLERRIPMGEKGIGRLSVSYLGNQMLMISKKTNNPANAFLIDWRILDNYNFFLEDLEIPIFSFDNLETFNDGFSSSKIHFLNNLEVNKWSEQKNLMESILEDWQSLNIPSFINEEIISDFCKTDYHGTSFIIFTPHEQLLELSELDLLSNRTDSSLNYLRASLSGLHNDFKETEKDFNTNFFIYDSSGKYDIIKDFFTLEEMRSADHWCKGTFNEHGFFEGELKIFDERFKYTFKPNRPPGKTPYGPFSIEWGFSEGDFKNTNLNDEQFRQINDKLKVLGGLYIYRDNFRVLPYGRPEVDFLEFEERRTRGAGYYFFSHRRFIGHIDISRESNHGLKDKAGREGFIQNNSYRQFRDDLIEFFIDISTKYLRKTVEGEEDTLRQSQLKEINEKHEKQLLAAKKKNEKTKKAFLENLSGNLNHVRELTDEIEQIEKNISDEVKNLEINYNNYNRLINSLDDKRSELRGLRLTKPKGIKLTNSKEKEFKDYQQNYVLAQDKVRGCLKTIEETRSRISIENLKLEFNDKFRSHVRLLENKFSSFQETSKDSFERIKKLLDEEKKLQIDSFITKSESLMVSGVDTKDVIALKIKSLLDLTEEQNTEIENSVSGFINHISNLQIDVDDDFLRGWYQEQNENLEKKIGDYEELAQLGMAIEIIDHQFNVMYAQMHDAINEIDAFSRKHNDSQYSFKQLKSAFQHLEINYKLLKPLYRTSRRTREIISGRELEKYLLEFFQNEFKKYRIDFSVNDAFRNYDFFSYDSIIKPTFLNIINNANYWLIPAHERKIRIELINDEIRIMNSGEKIDDDHLNDIFSLFFTRKRDGRGIGLYLARKNLNSVGYDIYATNDKSYNKLNGACFVIKKENK